MGPDHFVELLRKAETPEDARQSIRHQYRLGYHKVDRIVEILQHAEIWAVTELEAGLVRSMFIKPFETIQSAMDEAFSKKPGQALFVMNAGIVVPQLKKN